MSDRCRKLEQDLHTQRPEWIHKRDRYAVITEKDSVIMIARRHLDALEFLKVCLSVLIGGEQDSSLAVFLFL